MTELADKASLSATGLGNFFIQTPQNTILVTPQGFSGNALIPTSINSADLHVGFSETLTDFSIMVAPQDLNTPSPATMRVTAFMNGAVVGTSTSTGSEPFFWDSSTLSFSAPQGFNSVAVHYDSPPPGASPEDYGQIFVADNMIVTPVPEPSAGLLGALGIAGLLVCGRQRRKLC